MLNEGALDDVGSQGYHELDESDALDSDSDVVQDGRRQAVVAHDRHLDCADAQDDDGDECYCRPSTARSDRGVQLFDLLLGGLGLVVGCGGHFISRCVAKGCQRAIAYSSIYLQNCQYAVHW